MEILFGWAVGKGCGNRDRRLGKTVGMDCGDGLLDQAVGMDCGNELLQLAFGIGCGQPVKSYR